jgi:FkbM family methyltransferase
MDAASPGRVENVRVLDRLRKPWFVYQPAQLVRRAIAGLQPPPRGYSSLRTSWGVPIIADASRAIGRSIRTTGVYDLAVSEALARLISPGDTVVDAGANVGYMTVLAGIAAGPSGRVLAFEPHPELFAVAQRNVTAVRERTNAARIELQQSALGDRIGTAGLQVSPDFSSNDGTSRIAHTGNSGNESLPVAIRTLDDAIEDEPITVLKMDVEGFEPQLLRGASRALATRRIRHIVFEDHDIGTSEVVGILGQNGYRLFSLGWALRGLLVQPVELGRLATAYEAPNFIATLEPAEVIARCRTAGWLVLGDQLLARIREP